jgi:hypothetical protein
MKFFISLVSFSTLASPIHIFHEHRPERAHIVKSIFLEKYSVPEELVTLKITDSCEGLAKGGKLDLCLKNNGDLKVVSVDRGFISESLKIFQAP